MIAIGGYPGSRAGFNFSAFRSGGEGDSAGFLQRPAPFDRGWDAQGLAVFGDRAAGDVDAGFLQDLDDPVVGEHALGGLALGVDQALDAVAHGLRRVGLAPVARRRSTR